jgi:hypothetical protein
MPKTYTPICTILARHLSRIMTKHGPVLTAAINESALSTSEKAQVLEWLNQITTIATLLGTISGY